ncbi:DUF4386 family protein [Zavarzinia compransoris]|uniref:DUF4386 domain-containing protein n=1 Tax=Zavarzinia compransoris TaxID=1264899 RepID=A0A317E709_9PROT|nr:DUF4386 family protein [Zavarzinia compransoris]PWR22016.1 hypothetical protein DKG75_08540 [Zavarzinia compransoris]TDP47244.1 uncharacterized protein DUF4386 [Zavarzinia compransoris]
MVTIEALSGSATRRLSWDTRVWKFCAWMGPVYIVGSVIGFALIAGFMPPPAAHWGPQAVADFYTANSLGIRIGMVITLLFQPLYIVFAVAIAQLMRKAEGRSAALSTMQLIGAVLTWVIIVVALFLWLTAAFRPELRTPQDIMLLNDLGWITIDVQITCTLLQYIPFAVLFLRDRRAAPIVPAWLCWLTFAVGALYISDTMVPFFTTGPLAWNGLISFWAVYIMFFVWIIPVACYVIRGVDRFAEWED